MVTDKRNDLIGKQVKVWFETNTQAFRYQGILLELDSTKVVLDDFKEGIKVLPFAKSRVEEVKEGSDGYRRA